MDRSRMARGVGRRALHCSLLALAATWLLPSPARSAGASAPTGAARTVLVLGDSLSAEYGIARGSGWVALLERRLRDENIAANVINASISGDTTSGGRSRLPALLQQHKPSVVVIELGGNDALRGLPLSMTEANLQAMVRAAKSAGAKVLLAGMQVPPNYGRSYGDQFQALYTKVAKAENVAVVPFLLEGVANGPNAGTMFQSDRIHPTAEAHPIMLANVWPVLRPLLN